MYNDVNLKTTIHKSLSKSKKSQDAVALTVSGGATPNDTSDEIIVRGAQDLIVYAKNGNSTDLDIEVFVIFEDGETYTNKAYASMNLGASEVDAIPLNSGFYALKVKVTNNDASNATAVTAGVRATWR